MMETKEMLLETLTEDLKFLKAWQRQMPHDADELVQISKEIRCIVSLIAEIDHE